MRLSLTPSIFSYKKKYLKSDIIAALLVTAIAIPESLGFAVIVGLPAVTGLYSALFAPIVFGLLASTRRLVVGADSATAALIAGGAVLVAQSGTAEYAGAVTLISILTAVLLFMMAAFKLGFLADLISRPVMVGFLAGVGVQLIVTKLPEMLGISAKGDLWAHVSAVFSNLGSMNGMTVTVSILVVGIIVLTRATKIPGELGGLLLAGVFAWGFHIADYGVKLVGALPRGLPALGIPELNIGTVVSLLPAALSIALVVLAQSSAVIRSLAAEHDDRLRLNQDLFALGSANLASAMSHGFAINGSPPRSIASDLAGGHTQLVNILMGVLVGAVLLFGGDLFGYVPQAALSAVVCMIGLRLIRLQELRYIWTMHRIEFFVAMIALVVTALFGVLQGILIAVIVSLMERLSRQYRPRDEILLRDGRLSSWAQQRITNHDHEDNHPRGLLVYSFENSLFFENVMYFCSQLRRAVDEAKEPVHYVVVDAGAIDSIDYTAVEQIKQLYRQFGADGIKLGFAHVSPNLYEQFDDYGMTDLVGEENLFSTLNAAITGHTHHRHSVIERVKALNLPPDSYVVIGGAVLDALHLRNTSDIDLVVSDDTYAKFRDEKRWQQYTQDNGKRILSRDGYNLMHTWMGKSFKKLSSDAQMIDGVRCMSVEALVEIKKHLGRRKDMSDIVLLHDYQRTHRS
ncbi:SulP family inorganic anion transporter [Candidatus Saccharibacteria bacterium]|nr:MAG: SulP family inorganic anion transporter [Candidatus Saccharibacteria bacterium]